MKKVKVVTYVELGEYQFHCKKCKKIHTESDYCIAQRTLGYDMTFTCDCSNVISLKKRKKNNSFRE